MFPFARIVMRVVVAVPSVVDEIVKSGVFAAVVLEFEMERSEYGEVVPRPSMPVEEMKMEEVACATPASLPTRKFPLASAFEIGVKPKREEEATWYRLPELPAMRPESEPRIGSVEKVLVPLQVFELARRVVEAMVMSAEPLNETPLMLRAVKSVVAVFALPPIFMVVVEVHVGTPLSQARRLPPVPVPKSVEVAV